MAAAKRSATFRIGEQLLDGLQQVKANHGISVTDQITRAIEAWLREMRVPVMRGRSEVETRLVEHHSGVGKVAHPTELPVTQTVIKEVRYDLTVWQEIHHLQTMGGSSTVEGLKEVTGRIDVPGGVPLNLVGAPLMLLLDNGKRFKFFFQSSDGTIAPQGGIVG